MAYHAGLVGHYERCWGAMRGRLFFERGRVHELPEGFFVGVFGSEDRWVYASVGAGSEGGGQEFFVVGPRDDDGHPETVTVVTHYASTGPGLGVGHTVDLGKAWMPGSVCDHLLLSKAWLEPPELHWFRLGAIETRCVWLLPITRAEREYKRAHGLEALELLFEREGVRYWDPARGSLV